MAGRLTVTAFTHVEGPIFDGTAEDVLREFDRDVRQTIADKGVELLRAFPMDKTGRARGGFQAALKTEDRGAVTAIPGPMIRSVTWAPWLEGISKRNRSTHFPGYHLFRKTAVTLQDQAADIGDEVLQKYLPEMGGE